MNTNVIGYWSEKKEKLKKKFPAINDEDLVLYKDKEEEMMEMLAYKLRKTKEELRFIINDL